MLQKIRRMSLMKYVKMKLRPRRLERRERPAGGARFRWNRARYAKPARYDRRVPVDRVGPRDQAGGALLRGEPSQAALAAGPLRVHSSNALRVKGSR